MNLKRNSAKKSKKALGISSINCTIHSKRYRVSKVTNILSKAIYFLLIIRYLKFYWYTYFELAVSIIFLIDYTIQRFRSGSAAIFINNKEALNRKKKPQKLYFGFI